MNHTNDNLNLRSLAQHFDAPENYVGHFGWLCGYTADAAFLDEAAERFTRLTLAQRAYQGRIMLAVILDPRNPAISLPDASGVAHLPIRHIAPRPFRLLHAKVALLGFRHQEYSNQWRLRLLVSTGNWTRQTLEENLDLAWCLDVSSEALNKPDDEVLRCCADIKAANGFMKWIEKFFDTRLLDAAPNGRFNQTKHAREYVNAWIIACSKKAKGETRFIDNRKSSLLDQLPAKIRTCGRMVARNYLAMGSGFYETTADQHRSPEVPSLIIDTLREEALLTSNPELDLFVNPTACQAIATSVKVLNEQGVTIRPAAPPLSVFGNSTARTLHAKFLFSANYRTNSSTCNNGWVYLGSGNLTGPGFTKKMSATAGNLEAGVVFAPDFLYWEDGQGIEARHVVSNRLPIQWEDACDGDTNRLSSGPGMEPHDEFYIAPPIAWLTWHEADGINELRVTEVAAFDAVILDSSGNPCQRTETGFQWRDAQPRQVRIRWILNDTQHEANIPVIDQYGRIAATQLRELDIIDAWWQLADFPMPPDADGDDGEEDGNGRKKSAIGSAKNTGNYPVRQLMELVESIAAKQTEINEADWALWCNRLEQTLSQAKESPAIEIFHELGLNPLSPLRAAPFRPSFAETNVSNAGLLYEDTLARIEKAWAVDQLEAIGEMR